MNEVEATRLVNELFEALGAFMMRYAVRGTRCAQTAEDLVQEVFLALYRDLRNGKRIDDPRAWAVGALRNQVRKFVRSCRLRREDLSSPDIFDCMAAPADMNEGLDCHDDLGPAALRVLSPREEEVVLLRLQSLKYREIGQHLGISTKSVCTLLARALKKLQVSNESQRSEAKYSDFARPEVPDALQ